MSASLHFPEFFVCTLFFGMTISSILKYVFHIYQYTAIPCACQSFFMMLQKTIRPCATKSIKIVCKNYLLQIKGELLHLQSRKSMV